MVSEIVFHICWYKLKNKHGGTGLNLKKKYVIKGHAGYYGGIQRQVMSIKNEIY